MEQKVIWLAGHYSYDARDEVTGVFSSEELAKAHATQYADRGPQNCFWYAQVVDDPGAGAVSHRTLWDDDGS